MIRHTLLPYNTIKYSRSNDATSLSSLQHNEISCITFIYTIIRPAHHVQVNIMLCHTLFPCLGFSLWFEAWVRREKENILYLQLWLPHHAECLQGNIFSFYCLLVHLVHDQGKVEFYGFIFVSTSSPWSGQSCVMVLILHIM